MNSDFIPPDKAASLFMLSLRPTGSTIQRTSSINCTTRALPTPSNIGETKRAFLFPHSFSWNQRPPPPAADIEPPPREGRERRHRSPTCSRAGSTSWARPAPRQILHHEVAGPVPVRRGADHRDRADTLQNVPQFQVAIGDWFEVGHHSNLALPSAILRALLLVCYQTKTAPRGRRFLLPCFVLPERGVYRLGRRVILSGENMGIRAQCDVGPRVTEPRRDDRQRLGRDQGAGV